MSNDTVTKKKSAFLNNLKMQKLKSEMKSFKVDKLVKTADDHYIIFSGKTIFKSVNSGSEALLDIEKLKNGEITLGLTNLFEQKTINDVKDDVSNIEILDFYKDDYSSITRANDKEGNELIVGIRPGSMDDLTHSIITEGRKYIKTLNHIYHEDDVLNLLNTEIDNITPGELKLLTDFLNNNNPNIKDYSVNDDTSKPDIMAYKSIELESYHNHNDQDFKQYKITDKNDNDYYIIYWHTTKNPELIKEIYSGTEKMRFISHDGYNSVDASTVTIIIPNSTGKNSKNVSGYLFNFYDSKIYDCVFSNVGALCYGELTQYKFKYTINSSEIERYIIMDDFTTDMTLDFSSIGDVRKSWFNTTYVEQSVTNYFIYSTNREFKVNDSVSCLRYNSSTKEITGYDGNTYLSIKFCVDTGFTSTKYPLIVNRYF